MKVLVIGANGRLGRVLMSSLVDRGHETVAFVRSKDTFPAECQSKCAAIVEGDARNAAELEAAIKTHGCEGLVQAGGYTPFFPWTQTDMPLIYKATLDAAQSVGRLRSGGDATKPERRIRAWMMGDLALMDTPWSDGRLLES